MRVPSYGLCSDLMFPFWLYFIRTLYIRSFAAAEEAGHVEGEAGHVEGEAGFKDSVFCRGAGISLKQI